MGTSSILALKTALVNKFTADALIGGNGALVTFGLPSAPRRELPRDWVCIGNTHPENPTDGEPGFSGGQTSANMGQQGREERYTIEVVVSVLRGKMEDQLAVNTIAFGYSDAIENSIRAWNKQAGLNACDGVVRWCLVTELYHNDGVAPDGDRFCNVFITLAISNRI